MSVISKVADPDQIATGPCLEVAGDEATLHGLDRYKQLVESAVAVVHAVSTDGPEKKLNILAGRAIIEQAQRCHHRRDRVELGSGMAGAALIFRLSGTTSPPDGLPPLEHTPDAKAAADNLWEALTT